MGKEGTWVLGGALGMGLGLSHLVFVGLLLGVRGGIDFGVFWGGKRFDFAELVNRGGVLGGKS